MEIESQYEYLYFSMFNKLITHENQSWKDDFDELHQQLFECLDPTNSYRSNSIEDTSIAFESFHKLTTQFHALFIAKLMNLPTNYTRMAVIPLIG